MESRFDLADEPPLPVACFLHRLNRTLLAGFHPRNRVRVDRHPIPCAAPHHVKPQMFQAASSVLAARFRASSPDRHGFSFTSSLLSGYETRVGAPRRIQDVARVKASASDAEPRGIEQAAQVRAAYRLLVAADVLSDLERCQEAVRQLAECRR